MMYSAVIQGEMLEPTVKAYAYLKFNLFIM